MTTIWKSGQKKPLGQRSTNLATKNNAIFGTMLSPWSRQQKLATISALTMLGLLLAASACSKKSATPALVGVSGSAPAATTPASVTAPTSAAFPAPAKKTAKRRQANVTYSDTNSGVSFLYPRKFGMTSGEQATSDLPAIGNAPMNFVQPGGVTVTTVAVPAGSYPGTDFASAFFSVNVNRRVSAGECSHFGFVDTRNADGEPVDAEKVNVGSTEMEMTSGFSASAIKQDETQYYHNYENGACYEYVLGLVTEGFGTEDVKHVDRDEVFAKLEKILATVKIKPTEPEHVAEQTAMGMGGGKQ
jgi:hypothetical protein